MAILSNKDWILRRLEEDNNLKASISEYENFISETDSKASYTSFVKILSKGRKEFSLGRRSSLEESKGSVTVKHSSPSEAEASGSVQGIKDPEKIAVEWGIDLNVWQIADAKITKQTIYGEDRTGALRWDEGVMNGQLKYSGRMKDDIFHVKLNLVRKKFDSIDLSGIVQPVEIHCCYSIGNTVKPSASTSSKRVLVFGDAQMGFSRNGKKLEPIHDRKALDVILQLLSMEEYDHVIVNGDMLDLTEWSDKFIVSRDFKDTLQPALIELRWFLDQIVSLQGPDTKISYLEGNHEIRLTNAMIRSRQEATGLKRVDQLQLDPILSIPYMLGLDKTPIEWRGNYPRNFVWLREDIVISHSEKDRVNDRAMMSDLTYNEVIGHIHRVFSKYKTLHGIHGQKTIGLHGTGCLCKTDDSVPGKGNRRNWQQGFVTAEYDEDSKIHPAINSHLITNGRTTYLNSLEGKSYITHMEDDGINLEDF